MRAPWTQATAVAAIAATARDPGLVDRTWVLVTVSREDGWGIRRHVNTSANMVPGA